MSDYKKLDDALTNYRGSEYSKGYRSLANKYHSANESINKKIGHTGRSYDNLGQHAARLQTAKFEDDRALKGAALNTVATGLFAAGGAHRLKASPKMIAAAGGLTSAATGLAYVVHKLRTKKRLAKMQHMHDAFKKETEQFRSKL